MNVNIRKSEHTGNWHKTVVCDRCRYKKEATHRVGWRYTQTPLTVTDSMVLCDKCYEEFMTLFGNFKGAKFPDDSEILFNQSK